MSKPEYIIHCALDKNELTDTKNLISALEMAKQINCKGFITIGSYKEYGYLKKNLTEDIVCNPLDKFSRLKHSQNMLASQICDSLGINHLHLRLGIPYSHKYNTNFYFTNIIGRLSKDEFIDTKNIYEVKDFIHTSDIARGILSLMENNLSGSYNLSFGDGIEMKSVLKMIYEKLNKKFIFDESKNSSFSEFSLNINKIYKATNYQRSLHMQLKINQRLYLQY